MKKINLFICFILLGFTLNSCKKENANSAYPFNVRLTDATAPYDAVYIDLQGVEITGNDGNNVMMNVHSGIYNLLAFSNGLDTLIATSTLEIATVSQIRLILGPDNSVVVNNVSYP